MKHLEIKKAKAVAKAIPFDLIAVMTMFLVAALLLAMPAHAATERSASLYDKFNSSGHGFEVKGTAVGLAETDRAALEHTPAKKTFLLGGTMTAPSVDPAVNLYMTGGLGVATKDNSYIESAASTGVAPAFRVGMGIKYSF